MENRIIDSIIRFTSQHDVEAMEVSLVDALSDFLPATRITIIKSRQERFLGGFQQMLNDIMTEDGHNQQLTLFGSTRNKTHDGHVEVCRRSGRAVTTVTSEGNRRLLLPIFYSHKVSAILSLESATDLSDLQPIVEGIVRVYSNYLKVLNESEIDTLTGLYNRKTFDSKLNRMLQLQQHRKQEYEKSSRTNERRSLVTNSCAWLAIMDIDFLKQVNDSYGHLCGDEVIVTLAQQMRSFFRSSDLLFRFGGEEFIVVLEPITRHTAEQALNSFREIIAQHEFPQAGEITISIGFAKISVEDYPPYIIDNADKALYHAKDQGRNCVYNYEALVKEGLLTNK